SSLTLSWSPSTDGVAGYHVYRSSSTRGPFTRLTSALVNSTFFNDTTALVGDSTYMVRAVALQSNPSGSYFNPSQGVFVTATVPTAVPPSGGTNSGSFVLNPGTYNGLFYEGDQVRQSSA